MANWHRALTAAKSHPFSCSSLSTKFIKLSIAHTMEFSGDDKKKKKMSPPQEDTSKTRIPLIGPFTKDGRPVARSGLV